MGKYIGALDLGTTSNRFIIFDHGGQIVSMEQKEHEQIFPQPGWVEHNPMEIWENAAQVISTPLKKPEFLEMTWMRSASPTNAKPLWSGIVKPANRSIMRSSGSVLAPTRSART